MKVKKDNGKWEIMGPDQGVTWATNNAGVASISETGLVTKTGKGTTQITATVGGVTLECTVRLALLDVHLNDMGVRHGAVIDGFADPAQGVAAVEGSNRPLTQAPP